MSEEREENVTGRREAIKGLVVIAGAVATEPLLEKAGLADHEHHHGAHTAAPPEPVAAYQPVFFNEHQYKTIDVVSELIIPTTDTPGASAAGVASYIDKIVKEDTRLQEPYRQGLAWLDQKAGASYGAEFIRIKPDEQTALLTLISKPAGQAPAGKDPDSSGRDFFRTIKNMTVDGYYTSKVGIHQELKYKGNDYLTEFPGCTHPEHKG